MNRQVAIETIVEANTEETLFRAIVRVSVLGTTKCWFGESGEEATDAEAVLEATRSALTGMALEAVR